MNGIRQHKEMAMGKSVDGQGGNFGVEPFHSVNGGGPSMSTPGGHEMPHGHNAAMMGDHERGVGKHISRGKGSMGAQAHPDHGPHDHRPEGGSFGVESFKSMNG